MTNQSTWVIREIEHYETNQDLTPDTIDKSRRLLVDIVTKENILGEKLVDIPFPIETGHPTYSGHAFHLNAEGYVLLGKSKTSYGFHVYK